MNHVFFRRLKFVLVPKFDPNQIVLLDSLGGPLPSSFDSSLPTQLTVDLRNIGKLEKLKVVPEVKVHFIKF